MALIIPIDVSSRRMEASDHYISAIRVSARDERRNGMVESQRLAESLAARPQPVAAPDPTEPQGGGILASVRSFLFD